jgi:hypothetical protein
LPRQDRPARRDAYRPLRRVLIVCEDEKSSKYYFDSFPVDRRRIDIRTVGAGRNTDSLVEHAIALKREAGLRQELYNDIFCVFDRDSFPAHNFNRAFQLALNAGIRAIWANEAFELWYLLHFDFINSMIPRAQFCDLLDRKLATRYLKSDQKIYERLLENQPIAIRNAIRLRKLWIEMRRGGCDPESCNPSTNVQDLVEFLNQLMELGTTESERQ